jgi:hypothetical protein
MMRTCRTPVHASNALRLHPLPGLQGWIEVRVRLQKILVSPLAPCPLILPYWVWPIRVAKLVLAQLLPFASLQPWVDC